MAKSNTKATKLLILVFLLAPPTLGQQADTPFKKMVIGWNTTEHTVVHLGSEPARSNEKPECKTIPAGDSCNSCELCSETFVLCTEDGCNSRQLDTVISCTTAYCWRTNEILTSPGFVLTPEHAPIWHDFSRLILPDGWTFEPSNPAYF